MFSYIPKSMWFPTSVDVKHVATIEGLVKLCKAGEVERVIIPMTYYGYGATLADDSNRRSIKRHYAANRLKDYGYALTMSSYQFLKHEEFRELIEELQEQNPIFDEQDYSNLENETKREYVIEELETELFKREATFTGSTGEQEFFSKFYLDLFLLREDKEGNRIEWWEYVEIDLDGATPYMKKEDVEKLADIVCKFANGETIN